MMNELRITSPADILSFIPHTLGFAPKESFVFITMRTNMLGATLRVDAPQETNTAVFARAMADYLTLDGQANGAVLAVYTDQPATNGAPRPFNDHVEAIVETLDAAGIPLKDAWLVTSRHWKNLLCDDLRCCPIQSLEAITDGQLNAEMIYRGSSYKDTPGTTYPPFNGPADTSRKIDNALQMVQSNEPSNSIGLWAEAIACSGRISAETAVQLLACFQYPALRDTLMCTVIEPDRTTADGSGYLLLGEGIRPDWARVDGATDAARELISAAPGTYRAPLLTMIGWLYYLKGQSSVAAEHFTAALEDMPGYRLAELMEELISGGKIAPVAADETTGYKKP
ncbi:MULTISPECIES: DUF4192 domain-containing protein [Paenarthrobacter]|uniref:DUF4192 domain-containing protein n=1 Tax=Paenarthrobacter nicotinovorans TaxID=29320 RepID=Q8GAA9_PAENI|nr:MULTISPECIES: DUF4192 domain-containing protein [Paenarthrobacter]BCW12989.1 hypothetical protein NtRootA2_42710 [Arthrobacter sp. NtRootA2]BCW17286.1 hypothetical protein NtRootA4_42650 [Arthrobacter sp. NtRootA4]BCW25394.1 hypothetical protein NtRootC7_42610 [Arthrobacter sp. NtRootC7]BCW29596.1 hypothetical protein NtRootC45_41960 [Arthrobacter sp. NtRootC45]BCW33868.1 hypothetical protein NtRootD5_41990 [Arthrobacter sp. NtRootD5]